MVDNRHWTNGYLNAMVDATKMRERKLHQDSDNRRDIVVGCDQEGKELRSEKLELGVRGPVMSAWDK